MAVRSAHSKKTKPQIWTDSTGLNIKLIPQKAPAKRSDYFCNGFCPNPADRVDRESHESHAYP